MTHPPEEFDVKRSTDEASSSFGNVPKAQPAPVFSGSQADFATSRPHKTSIPEEVTVDSDINNAMAVRSDDPPEIRLKKLALKIFQNGGSYKTVAGNLGISRDKARTWKRFWQSGRFEDNIRGIRFSGDYSAEIKAKVRERFRAGATAGELEKEFKIPRQTIRKWL